MKSKNHQLSRFLRIFILIAVMLFTVTGIQDSAAYSFTASISKAFGTQEVQAKSKKNKNKNKDKKKYNNKNTNNSGNKSDSTSDSKQSDTNAGTIDKNGTYTSKDDVAAYIHEYNCLPKNFITKRDAQDLGWDSSMGNLDEVAPGMSIGGDKFGNYEGQLPEKDGRKYKECDINYSGGYRGSERIIFSNDGLIYYTNDHYKTFTQLY